MARTNKSRMLIDDGILVWFDGPEWDDAVAEAFEEAGSEIVASAQQNAPWEDRSGDARSGIEAHVENLNGEVVLTLFHTVEYGLWLEVIQSGRFATIMPTLEKEAPKALKAAEKAVANARRGSIF